MELTKESARVTHEGMTCTSEQHAFQNDRCRYLLCFGEEISVSLYREIRGTDPLVLNDKAFEIFRILYTGDGEV